MTYKKGDAITISKSVSYTGSLVCIIADEDLAVFAPRMCIGATDDGTRIFEPDYLGGKLVCYHNTGGVIPHSALIDETDNSEPLESKIEKAVPGYFIKAEDMDSWYASARRDFLETVGQ